MKEKFLLFIIAVLLIWAGAIRSAGTQSSPVIRLQPEVAMADQMVKISVSGLRPGQAVTLKASMADRQGKVWRSQAEFVADRSGRIDLTKQAPVSGTYTGVDPMGLVWSMDLTSEKIPVTAPVSPLSSLITKFELEANNSIAASASLKQMFVTEGVRAEEVRDDGLVAKLYRPEKGGPHPGIIVLGGSEGGITSAESAAALLTSQGYAALAVAYFRMAGLPNQLAEIQLEYLKKAIDWLMNKEGVDRNRIAVLGWSKGGELALLLSSYFPELKVVVAYVPSGIVWQSIRGGRTSSWSYQGKPLPFVPYGQSAEFNAQGPNQPRRMALLYLAGLEDKESVSKATIAVEKINGPVLLISGKDDQLWPSPAMAEMVINRLRAYKHPYRYEHLSYEHAGHNIGLYYEPTTRSTGGGGLALGGTPEGNARAQAGSWPRVLQFLKEGLTKSRK